MAKFARSISWGRSAPGALLGMIAAAALAAACSEGGSAATTNADAALAVEITQTSIAVQNRAGLPLTDVVVTIVPFGGIEFDKRLPRVENLDRREIPMAEFRSRDGSAYNSRLMRPKAVRVRGSDVAGKRYEVELPLK